MTDRSPRVRDAACTNAALPVSLEALFERPRHHLADADLCDPPIAPVDLEAMAAHRERGSPLSTAIRYGAARHPSLPVASMVQLVEDNSAFVRAGLACNPALSVEIFGKPEESGRAGRDPRGRMWRWRDPQWVALVARPRQSAMRRISGDVCDALDRGTVERRRSHTKPTADDDRMRPDPGA